MGTYSLRFILEQFPCVQGPTPRAAGCKVHGAVFHHWSGEDQTHVSMLVFFVPLGPPVQTPMSLRAGSSL